MWVCTVHTSVIPMTKTLVVVLIESLLKDDNSSYLFNQLLHIIPTCSGVRLPIVYKSLGIWKCMYMYIPLHITFYMHLDI